MLIIVIQKVKNGGRLTRRVLALTRVTA